jgi:ABC-2 type transport system permease protein
VRISRRSLAVCKRILFGLLHEPRTLVLVFLAPVLVMVVFGLAFSGEVRHVRVMVVNHDRAVLSPSRGRPVMSKEILACIDREVLDIVEMAGEAEAVAEVEAGRASAVMIFPANFTAVVERRATVLTASDQAEVVLRLDRTVFTVPSTITQAVQDAVIQTLDAKGPTTSVHLDVGNPVYGAHAQFVDYYLPGVIGFTCFFLTMLLTILSIVGERRSGTLERLLTTPIRESEIVAGYALLYGGIGVVQSCLLLVTAASIFHVNVVGSILLAFVPIALLSLVSLSLGVFLSVWARTELQAVQMVSYIVLPTFLLSGVFWPIDAMPAWLRPVTYLFPPSHAVEALRFVVGRGWGFSRVWPQLAALAGFAVVFLAGSSVALRRARA